MMQLNLCLHEMVEYSKIIICILLVMYLFPNFNLLILIDLGYVFTSSNYLTCEYGIQTNYTASSFYFKIRYYDLGIC